MRFERLYNFIRNPTPWINATIREIIRENQTDIILLNTKSQLYDKGEDSKGVDLGTYRPFTIAKKKAKGMRYDHVTLLDTGDFYDSIIIQVFSNYFKMSATDDKTEMLEDKFTEDIVGLSEQSIKIMRDTIIIPNFRKKLKNYLNGI